MCVCQGECMGGLGWLCECYSGRLNPIYIFYRYPFFLCTQNLLLCNRTTLQDHHMSSLAVNGIYVNRHSDTIPLCCLQWWWFTVAFTVLSKHHLFDGDQETWMHAIHSQLKNMNHVIKKKKGHYLACSCTLKANISHFYTGQQATNLAVRFAARSMDLDRRWWGLFWFANMGDTFLPPPLLCKSELSMCRQWREISQGVDDVHCCVTHSRGVLKPGNSWSQQSVHHFIRRRQDEQLDSRWDPGDASVSSVSVAVFVVHLLL